MRPLWDWKTDMLPSQPGFIQKAIVIYCSDGNQAYDSSTHALYRNEHYTSHKVEMKVDQK